MDRSSKKIKIRLKPQARKRYQMLVLACMLLFSVYLWFGPIARAESAVPVTTREYRVNSGDTLWEIAENIAPNMDPREVIYEIKTLNGGSSDIMYTGNVIIIPVY